MGELSSEESLHSSILLVLCGAGDVSIVLSLEVYETRGKSRAPLMSSIIAHDKLRETRRHADAREFGF